MTRKVPQLQDEVFLRTRYLEQEKTLDVIASEAQCSKTIVSNALKRYNITSRKPSEYVHKVWLENPELNIDFPDLYNVKWLKEKYISQRLGSCTIAKEIGCSSTRVLNALKSSGIQIRSKGGNGPRFHMRASKHPNYKHGKYTKNGYATRIQSFYNSTYWKKIRLAVLERDNFHCVTCNLSNDQNNKKFKKGLEVHHIDHNQFNNKLTNLKTLCLECHSEQSNHNFIQRFI